MVFFQHLENVLGIFEFQSLQNCSDLKYEYVSDISGHPSG